MARETGGSLEAYRSALGQPRRKIPLRELSTSPALIDEAMFDFWVFSPCK